jgi:hypothetical protein
MELRRKSTVLVAVLSILACCASAQEFEVASIKPAAPDERRTFIGPGPGGGISVTNMTLKQMIQNETGIAKGAGGGFRGGSRGEGIRKLISPLRVSQRVLAHPRVAAFEC